MHHHRLAADVLAIVAGISGSAASYALQNPIGSLSGLISIAFIVWRALVYRRVQGCWMPTRREAR